MPSEKNLKLVDDEVYRYKTEDNGLYEKAINKVLCPACRIELVTITVVDDKPIETNHFVICPDCGEESFKVKTSGSYVYSYPEDSKIVPIDIQYSAGKKEDPTHESKLFLKRVT